MGVGFSLVDRRWYCYRLPFVGIDDCMLSDVAVCVLFGMLIGYKIGYNEKTAKTLHLHFAVYADLV